MIETKQSWTIRLATETDQRAIYQLIEQEKATMLAAGIYQWTEFYPNQAIIQSDIMNQQLVTLVIADEIVSVATVFKINQWDYQIERIVTKRQYASKGYATCLVQAIINQIKTKKGKHIYSSTNHTNQQMHYFFTKLGFEKISEFRAVDREHLGSFYEYLKKI